MMKSKPLDQIIAETVRGEHEGWPLDPAFRPEPSHEIAFRKGDGQRVLWQIYDCIKADTPVPEWAATAFCDILTKAATCNTTWDKSFGEIPAKGSKRRARYRSTLRDLGKNLIRVGEAVRDCRPKDDEMWHRLSKKFSMSRDRLKRCWKLYRHAHNLSD